MTTKEYIDGVLQDTGGGGGDPNIFSSLIAADLNVDTAYPQNTFTTIKFNSVDIDENSDYSSSTGKITIPADGTYEFSAQIIIETARPTYDYRLRLFKNGTDTLTQPRFFNTTAQISRFTLVMSPQSFELTTGDEMEFQFYHDYTTTTSLDGLAGICTYMSCKRLS